MKKPPAWRDPLILVALCGLGIFLGRQQSAAQREGRTDAFGSVAQRLLSPVSLSAGRSVGSAGDFQAGIGNAAGLAAENRRLRAELLALQMYGQTVTQLRDEIDSLRSLAGLPGYGKTKLPAEITQFFPYEDRISLNVGSQKGVRPGQPVVAPQGLLGIVKSVDQNSCSVLLLVAPSQKLGAIAINRNPPPAGFMRGDGDGGMLVEFQDPKVGVQTGDTITTAGFSDKIPRGIVIGRVLVAEADIEFGVLRARVLPAVSLGRVREVVVLR